MQEERPGIGIFSSAKAYGRNSRAKRRMVANVDDNWMNSDGGLMGRAGKALAEETMIHKRPLVGCFGAAQNGPGDDEVLLCCKKMAWARGEANGADSHGRFLILWAEKTLTIH